MSPNYQIPPQEQKRIRQLNDRLSGEIKIGLVEAQDPRSRQINDFCAQLTRLVPKIRLLKSDEEPPATPAILIGSGVRYQGVPQGAELEPFLEALATLDKNSLTLAAAIQAQSEDLPLPALLQIYVTPQCKFCPQAVRQFLPLATAPNPVRLTVVDCTLFPELAQTCGIKAAPTVVLDHQFQWTGTLQLDEIVAVIKNRDPAQLGPTSLESILKEGKASQLAAMMLDRETIFPAIYDLLTHAEWPVRLGAMVVMEELAHHKPALAAQTLAPLWARFAQVADQIKGDLLYIFGEIGSAQMIAPLEGILKGHYDSEVKEAALEALAKMRRCEDRHDSPQTPCAPD
ncbi:MAG: thioredoxin family protein [Desulfobacterales bacterium]|nr:MAG: thioredoxin family protein [Desulfobacterales bacterium]